MPVWAILVVAGVLVVAAVVLIIAVYILDVHAEQQCAHLRSLTQRSLQQQSRDRSQHQARVSCGCSSIRNCRLQLSTANSQLKNNLKVSASGGLLQPLMDAACRKSSLSSGSLECLSGLANRRRGMANGLQGGWFNGLRFCEGNGEPREDGAAADYSRTPVTVRDSSGAEGCSSSAGSFSLPSETVGESDLDSATTITATITTTDDSSSSSPSSSRPASSVRENVEGSWKSHPQRRLVLEILMSSCGAEDGAAGANLPRATGVRLKLETNASLESLASLAAAASSGEETVLRSQGLEMDSTASEAMAALASSGVCDIVSTSLTRGNVNPPDEADYVSKCSTNGGTGADDKRAGLAPLSTAVAHKVDVVSPEGSTDMRMSELAANLISSSMENDSGTKYSTASAGQEVCSILLDKQNGGFPLPGTTSTASLETVSCKTRSNGNIVGANSSTKAKGKVGSSSTNSNVCTVSAQGSSVGSSGTQLSGLQSQTALGLPLDGLGSLRISVDGIIRGKSLKECPKGVTAEIASALAALSVESMDGKAVAAGLPTSPGAAPPDTSEKAVLCEKLDVVQEEEGPGEGSGSEQVFEEMDDRHPVSEAVYDEGFGNKKEKRKKKNRGRRQKAKAAAVAAAAAGGFEVKERHVNGKRCIEAVAILPVSGESEVGCICGAPKGGCHSNACPYPFTSSGSMVQRKIKEQYDELVRSNIAKTLTLAQVGRFTTCLVEAKSALQQKSDNIQRRFTIAKSLLSKADKSSFDRLCGQIYGLEIEQKKLEEDTLVYNRLQEQLKLSPAYQKMLEYGRTHFELQPNTGRLIEKIDSEEGEISFEELLAQEKKDSFWAKHGQSRSSMQVT